MPIRWGAAAPSPSTTRAVLVIVAVVVVVVVVVDVDVDVVGVVGDGDELDDASSGRADGQEPICTRSIPMPRTDRCRCRCRLVRRNSVGTSGRARARARARARWSFGPSWLPAPSTSSGLAPSILSARYGRAVEGRALRRLRAGPRPFLLPSRCRCRIRCLEAAIGFPTSLRRPRNGIYVPASRRIVWHRPCPRIFSSPHTDELNIAPDDFSRSRLSRPPSSH
jgi:hypothetical protein